MKIKISSTHLLFLSALIFFIPSPALAEVDNFSSIYKDLSSVSTEIKPAPSENIITIENIMKDHLPKFPDGIVYSDNIEFKGKLKKEIIPVFEDELKKLGWDELILKRQCSTQFFFKVINGQGVTISMVPAERGGPEKENTSTFIYFRIISQRKKK